MGPFDRNIENGQTIGIDTNFQKIKSVKARMKPGGTKTCFIVTIIDRTNLCSRRSSERVAGEAAERDHLLINENRRLRTVGHIAQLRG